MTVLTSPVRTRESAETWMGTTHASAPHHMLGSNAIYVGPPNTENGKHFRLHILMDLSMFKLQHGGCFKCCHCVTIANTAPVWKFNDTDHDL